MDQGEDWDERREQSHAHQTDSDGRLFSPLRAVTAVGGVALAGTYALPWVDVVGPTEEGPDAGTIDAREIVAVPEVVLAIGIVALAVALVRWNRWTQLAVLVLGLVGTGMTLFFRFFLGTDEQLIEVGDAIGPPAAFDPAVGLTAALALSLVLVGVSFVAILRTFSDDVPSEHEQ